MGRAEKVAKLEALLERVQQRAALPRVNESGVVMALSVEAVSAEAVSPEVSPEVVPLARRRPAEPRPPVAEESTPRPVAARRPSVPNVPATSPDSRPTAPRLVPEPMAASAMSPLPNLDALDPMPREAMLTPTAVISPYASEKALRRMSPEMTAPVSAEEVAAAAAAMNRVPTFPDAFPVDASAAAVVSAASARASAPTPVVESMAGPVSAPQFDVGAGPGHTAKDVYLEDIEEPTKPLAHPPRSSLPKSAQQLAAEIAASTAAQAAESAPQKLGVSDSGKVRPVTIPFDSYPPRTPGEAPAPLQDVGPRAMVVPRDVDNAPFLSNLRPQPEKKGGGIIRFLLVVLVLAGAGYAAYAYGLLAPLLK